MLWPSQKTAVILKQFRDLRARIDTRWLEMIDLCASRETQLKRIAEILAELDVHVTARKRRQAILQLGRHPACENGGDDGR